MGFSINKEAVFGSLSTEAMKTKRNVIFQAVNHLIAVSTIQWQSLH